MKFAHKIWRMLRDKRRSIIGKAKALAKELDIPIRFKRNWDKSYTPVNREYLLRETGFKELTVTEYTASREIHPTVCANRSLSGRRSTGTEDYWGAAEKDTLNSMSMCSRSV